MSKALLIVDIPDDYQEYGSGDWYVVGDDLRIVSEEDGALMTYKFIDDDIEDIEPISLSYRVKSKDLDMGYYLATKDIKLKPMPKRIGSASEYGSDEVYIKHLINWKKEIDELIGETE